MKNIDSFKTAQTLSAAFTHEGTQYRAVISTPDLRSATSTCWGDWGPMYTFRLESRESVTFRYFESGKNELFESVAHPAFISLNSPMLASVRSHYPFCLELRDEESGLNYSVFFSPEATVSGVQVEVTSAERLEQKLSEATRPKARLSA